MAHERICVVCGKQYRYCRRCKEFEHLPTWMFSYCSEQCKETYMTLNKFEFGHIDAKTAIEELNSNKVKVANEELLKSVTKIKKEVSKSKKAKNGTVESDTVNETIPVESD